MVIFPFPGRSSLLPISKTNQRSIPMFSHLSRHHLQTSVVLPSPSQQPGSPFVSSFCTPNPNQWPIHTHCYRPPPSVPKMPLGARQICSRSASEDRPSVKCMCAHVCVWSLGGGSQSAVSVNVYLHTALVTSVLKSPQLLYYEVPALSFLCTSSDVANSIADGLKDLYYPKSLLVYLRQIDLNLGSFYSWLNVFVCFFSTICSYNVFTFFDWQYQLKKNVFEPGESQKYDILKKKCF